MFILNDKKMKITKFTYDDNCISISSNNYFINLDFSKKLDLNLLKNNVKKNISEYLYLNQNFVTHKYSYVINIGKNIFITRKSEYKYLFELFIPDVEVLIPPFNNVKHIRENLEKNEINKLEIKIYFEISKKF